MGSYLLKILLENGNRVFCLARSKKDKSAEERIIALLNFWDTDMQRNLRRNLIVVEGDITYPALGVKSKKMMEELISETEIIFHSAALAKFRVPLPIISKINIEGTKNVLNFALECRQLKKVNHVSTAHLVGTKRGIDFSEDMFDIGQKLYSTYKQTKYEAEILVREYQKKGLDTSIFRPSIIMGDSISGKINNFRIFYEPLHFFSHGIYNKFPANPGCLQNLINIDTAARAIFILGEKEGNHVYHITSPQDTTIGFFMELAAGYFKFKMPQLIPWENFDFKEWTPVKKALADPYIPYFNSNTKFLSQKTQEVLKKYSFEYPPIDTDNVIRIFEYCSKRGFVKRRK